jgi:hypothetical protein
MKKVLFTLLFTTLMFSSPIYAEWTKIFAANDGTNYYVDFDRIRQHDGHYYYWSLIDYIKPNPHGDLSSKTYSRGDCELYRVKILSYTYHRQPMGLGNPSVFGNKEKEWINVPPGSGGEAQLITVCPK